MTAKNINNFDSETRLALLEQTNKHIYETLNRIEKRFDKLESKIDKNFITLLSIYLGGYAGVLGIMAKALHWI